MSIVEAVLLWVAAATALAPIVGRWLRRNREAQEARDRLSDDRQTNRSDP